MGTVHKDLGCFQLVLVLGFGGRESVSSVLLVQLLIFFKLDIFIMEKKNNKWHFTFTGLFLFLVVPQVALTPAEPEPRRLLPGRERCH